MIAAAITGTERVRFDYRAGDGARTKRQVEPYRLVSTARRWYLVAYDLAREDWRTFRVDRVGDPYATGARFTPRELPTGDAAEFLTRSMWGAQPQWEVDVSFAAPAEFVAGRLPPSLGVPEPTGPGSCRLRATVGDSLEWLALRLALVDCEFTVHAPARLVEHIRAVGAADPRGGRGRRLSGRGYGRNGRRVSTSSVRKEPRDRGDTGAPLMGTSSGVTPPRRSPRRAPSSSVRAGRASRSA